MRRIWPHWALLITLLLSACVSSPLKSLDDSERSTIAMEALGQIGRPYRYGGTTQDGFDCSGLVQYSYAQAGIKIPRTTSEQLHAGKKISLSNALPGDLLFYKLGGGLHVALYVGDGRAVHAPARGRQVIVAPVDADFWQENFVTAIRVLR
ncbi:C40 family peptidase [Stenotrophobium rhamnosiphilum]|nr:C40 family peptidase [Stenotrophobium rhamnosiphilum]